MTGLLIKDLKLFRHQGRYYLGVLVLACIIMFTSTKDFSSFISSYLTIMIGMYSFSSFSYDEYDNGLSFLMTLPCGRRAYVAEKYIFTILLVTGGWAAGIAIQAVGYMMRFPAEAYQGFIVADLIYLLIVLVYVECCIPAMIWFGAEKGRNILLAGLGILAFLIFVVAKSGVHMRLGDVAIALLEAEPGWMLLFLLLLCMLVLGISYKFSVHLIEKKEF